MRLPGAAAGIVTGLSVAGSVFAQTNFRGNVLDEPFVQPLNTAYDGPPDILFILADDLGVSDISAFGSRQVDTPNIDGIMSRGIGFLSYHTPPVCSPSRVSTMTGRHMIHHGLYDPFSPNEAVDIPQDMKFLPQYLEACCNYSNHAVGKWHMGFHEMQACPTGRGFQNWQGIYNGAADYYTHDFAGGYDYHEMQPVEDGILITHELDLEGTFAGYIVADRVVELVESEGPRFDADGNSVRNPWFIYSAFQNPHFPLEVPDEYFDVYSPLTGNDTAGEYRATVLALSKQLDDAVGQIIQALQDNGSYDNTIVIFASDHGGPSNLYEDTWSSSFPLRGGKNMIWEGGTRTVGMIQGPNIPARDTWATGKFDNSDWLPTLVAAARGMAGAQSAGIDVLDGIFPDGETQEFIDGDGVNQWDFILSGGNSKYSNRNWVLHCMNSLDASCKFGEGITMGDWKYIHMPLNSDGNPDDEKGWPLPPGLTDADRDPDLYPYKCDGYDNGLLRTDNADDCTSDFCLFNITADPCEYYDLSAQYPEVVAEMAALVAMFEETTSDQVPDREATDERCGAGDLVETESPHWQAYQPCDYVAPATATTTIDPNCHDVLPAYLNFESCEFMAGLAFDDYCSHDGMESYCCHSCHGCSEECMAAGLTTTTAAAGDTGTTTPVPPPPPDVTTTLPGFPDPVPTVTTTSQMNVESTTTGGIDLALTTTTTTPPDPEPNKYPMPGSHLYCTSSQPGAYSINVTDGNRTRCYLVIPPAGVPASAYPLPVVFIFHGSWGSAEDCGENAAQDGWNWVDLGKEYGFILLCVESAMYKKEDDGTIGGIWDMPPVSTNATGPRCALEDSLDNIYMANVLASMESCPGTFNMKRMATHGCSGGSAAAIWQAVCLYLRDPESIFAFASNSIGLKVKGDGNNLGAALYDVWGECDQCEFFPTVPGAYPGMKACVIDNYDDPNLIDPYYYRTNLQLAEYWRYWGNEVEEHYHTGGHCGTYSNLQIAQCMDDGTGKLRWNQIPFSTTSTTTAPTTVPADCVDNAPPALTETCEELVANNANVCTNSWLEGYCCKTCHGCSAECIAAAQTTTPHTTTAVDQVVCTPTAEMIMGPATTTTRAGQNPATTTADNGNGNNGGGPTEVTDSYIASYYEYECYGVINSCFDCCVGYSTMNECEAHEHTACCSTWGCSCSFCENDYDDTTTSVLRPPPPQTPTVQQPPVDTPRIEKTTTFNKYSTTTAPEPSGESNDVVGNVADTPAVDAAAGSDRFWIIFASFVACVVAWF